MNLELMLATNVNTARGPSLDLASIVECRERMRGALLESPLEAGLEACARDLMRLLRVDLVEIWKHASDQPIVHQVVAQGRSRPLDAPARVALSASLPVARCARSGEAGRYEPGNQMLPIDFQRWMQREGLASHAVYPLMSPAGVIGVLVVFSQRQLDDDFLAVLALCADVVASALERVRHRHEHESSWSLLRGIEQVDALAMAAIDGDCRVRFWTAGARELFGWSREEVAGIGLPIVPEGTHPLLVQVFDEILRGEPGPTRSSKLTRDGVAVELLVRTIPLVDPAGSAIGTLGVFTTSASPPRVG